MKRRAAIAILALVTIVAALVLVLHTPFVRGRVLTYVLSTVQERYGIRIEATRLDYNLAALRVGLAGVRISAVTAGAEPFFEADYVSASLPSSALLGDVAFDAVSVTNGHVQVITHRDGTNNLPPSSAERATEEPPPLRIALIDIPRLRVDVRDEQQDLDVSIPAAAIRLTRDAGRVALAQPAAVRLAARRTTIAQLEGGATFDGRALGLEDVRVRSDEGSLRVDGSLVLIARDATVDLMVAGTAEVARLARWGISEGELPTGTVAIEGRVAGALATPDADLRITSTRLGWQGYTITDVTTRARVSSASLRIQELGFAFEGGRVTAAVSIPFAEDTDGYAALSWTDLDASRIVRLAAPRSTVVPAAITRGQLSASGPLANADAWAADLRVQFIPGVNARNRVSIGGDAHLTLANGSWRLDSRQRVGGLLPVMMALRGRVINGRQTDSTLAGYVEVAQTPLLPLFDLLRTTNIADVPKDMLSSGTAQASLELSGTAADPRVGFTASADTLTVDQANAAGRLTAVGTYSVRREQYSATVTGTDWQIMPTAERPLSGRLDLTFMGSGTIDRPGGRADLTLRDAVWDDRRLGDVVANVTLDGRTAVIDARAPEFSATAAGRVGIDAPYVAAVDIRADNLDLARILHGIETPVRLAGTTTVSAHAEGPLESWRRGTATVDVASFEASAGDLPIRLAEPARIAYADDRVRIERFEATAGETRLSASGDLPLTEPPPGAPASAAAVLMTVTGDVGEIAKAVAASGLTEAPIVGGSGPVALLARVTGSAEMPVIAADLEAGPGSVIVEGFPQISNVRLRAHAENGWVELREANASYQDASVSATGKAPISLLTGAASTPSDGSVELHARATNITPRVLESMVDPTTLQDIAGTVDLTADLSSPTLNVENVAGEIRLDRLELRAADLPVTQRTPTRISVRDGFARIEAFDWEGQGATLSVRGQARLSDRQLAILANGTVDLRMLTPFIREAGMSASGTLAPRLSITGAADDPRIDGDLSITGAEMRLADPRVLLSDLTARAVLTRNSATLTALNGMVNGGPLTGEGMVRYDADGTVTGELTADIRGMALEFPPGLRSEVSAALTLALQRAAGAETPSAQLTGTTTVVRGFYREPLAVVTGLLTTLRTRRLASAAEPSPFLDALTLDIRLLTDEDIIVDNNYGKLQLGGDLRVIGTGSAPALSGRAEIRQGGQLFVGRNIYTINFGTIDFSNPVTIEPDLDVQAATRVAGEDIEVTIRGTPETISVGLASPSNTSLGEAEIASLLLTGRRYEDLDPTDAAFVGTQVLGNFSAEVLGFAGRAVGLDTLRLGGVESGSVVSRDPSAVATEVDPTTRLTFGKMIGSNVDLTFSQSLRESDAQTWIIDYLPARRLDLRLVSGDDDLRSYSFRHDMTFGGGSAQQAQGGRIVPRAREQRVGMVTIGGDLGFPEDRIREELRLKPGSRFDFGDWQEDRDRTEAFYRRSGYLIARVTASRSELNGEVGLNYQIVPGPKTSIAVNGIDMDGALRARLEESWSNAVFDDFLVDEAVASVKERLSAEGYLRPMVTARVEGDATAKVLVITVDRGERISNTVVDVRRADSTDSSSVAANPQADAVIADVNAFLESRGLVARAVVDPGSLEREVTAYLRGKGHLRTKVTAGAPRFEGPVATVPLTVDPGPVFTVASVQFDGAQSLPIDTVRDTAAVSEGMLFAPDAPDAARARLIALYRREAFPTPMVEVHQIVRDTDPLVDLTFAINEGPRQLLSEVVVTGNRGIDSDVIVRALDLRLEEPLRAEESLRARTRVFETGLFRRVDVTPEPIERRPTDAANTTPMRLKVTVEEWPALQVRYGLQVAEERPEGQLQGRDLIPGLQAELRRRALFGRAIGLGGVVELQRRAQLGRVLLNAPTFGGWPIESSLVLQQSRQTFSAATLVTSVQSIAWEQRTRFKNALSLLYTYRFERNHTFDTEPSPDPTVPPFDITVNVARLTTTGAWDTRDDAFDATRGTLMSSSIEFAPTSLGSDIRFVRSLTQAYNFLPWRGVVFASAARLGVATPLGEQELIPSERFFAGGAGTVRGVAEDSLGPRDFFGDPRGGKTMIVLNQEARIPVHKWVRAVGFFDAGNVFERWSDVRFGDLVGSIGVGVRVTTPFALLRADYARAIWTGSPAPTSRFIFGIGQAF